MAVESDAMAWTDAQGLSLPPVTVAVLGEVTHPGCEEQGRIWNGSCSSIVCLVFEVEEWEKPLLLLCPSLGR